MNVTAISAGSRISLLERPAASLARFLLVATVFLMPISTALTNVTMALCLLAWLASGDWKNRFHVLKMHEVAWWVMGIFVLTCLGALYSSASAKEIAFQLHKHARLLFFIPALTLLEQESLRRKCLYAFCAAMLLTLILSLASVVTPLAIVKGTAGGPSTNHFVFKDHIAQNLMMSFFVLVMLIESQTAKTSWQRNTSYLMASLAIADILFFVQGRTGYVSLALNLIAFVVLLARGRKRLIFAAIFAMASALTLTFSPNFNQRIELTIKEYTERDKKELTSVGQRMEFLEKSLQLIKESPIIGHGTGSYGKEFCRVAESAAWCEAGKAHPHNQFMSMGVQFGIIGIFAYLGLIASIVYYSMKFSPAERLLGTGIALTLIADSLFHAPLFLVTEAQFFTLMMAIVLSSRKVGAS